MKEIRIYHPPDILLVGEANPNNGILVKIPKGGGIVLQVGIVVFSGSYLKIQWINGTHSVEYPTLRNLMEIYPQAIFYQLDNTVT